MAFKSKDGEKRFGNRQKANRYDRAHAGPPEGDKLNTARSDKSIADAGPRAQAHEVEATASKMEQQEGEAPHGAAESGDMVAKEHGPAHEVHITHDHATGQHHVHSVHQDGHQNHSVHATPEEAHMHAQAAAGIPGGMEEKEEGEYPAKHKAATADGEEDEYEAPPL
jgi:hypothetical protein